MPKSITRLNKYIILKFLLKTPQPQYLRQMYLKNWHLMIYKATMPSSFKASHYFSKENAISTQLTLNKKLLWLGLKFDIQDIFVNKH